MGQPTEEKLEGSTGHPSPPSLQSPVKTLEKYLKTVPFKMHQGELKGEEDGTSREGGQGGLKGELKGKEGWKRAGKGELNGGRKGLK